MGLPEMSELHETPGETRSRRIVLWTLFVNVLLLGGLFAVYFVSSSQLVLAQAADSLFDLAAGAILAVAVSVSTNPKDENHPFGHRRAEPVGALVAAIFAGVLGFEVVRTAAWTLVSGEFSMLEDTVAHILGAKGLVKLVLFFVISRQLRDSKSPALRATWVDTRNDLLATSSSLVGFALNRAGFLEADSVLAIPIGLYIGWSGLELLRENLRYLMGEAPDEETRERIAERAAGVQGVLRVSKVRAQYLGQKIHVEVTILVEGSLSVTEGHDLALEVRQAIERLDDVDEAFVHVDTEAARAHA